MKHSMHLLRSRLCWQMLFPLQSVQKVEYSASDRSALVTPRLKQKPKMKLKKTSIDKHRCAGSVNLLRACARLGSSESSRLASHVRCIRSFCAHRDTKRTLPTFALAPKPLVRTDLGAPTFFADAALSAGDLRARWAFSLDVLTWRERSRGQVTLADQARQTAIALRAGARGRDIAFVRGWTERQLAALSGSVLRRHDL